MPGLDQRGRHHLPVGAGRFPAGVHPPGPLAGEPGEQLGAARGRVRAGLAAPGAIREEQGHVKFDFADIDPEYCVHASLRLGTSYAVSLVNAGSTPTWSGLRYRSTGRPTLSA